MVLLLGRHKISEMLIVDIILLKNEYFNIYKYLHKNNKGQILILNYLQIYC